MTVGAGFRRVARVIRRLERAGWTVRDVKPDAGDGLRRGDTVSALVDCQRPPTRENGEATPLEEIEIGSDATDVSTLTVIPRSNGGQSATLRLRVAIDVGAELNGNRVEDDESAGPERPLHRDPERLRELYHSHSSFAEIAGTIDEDVSAETIRRYMIEHEIHEPGGPGPRDISDDIDEDSRPLLGNGHGIPKGIDVETLVSAVEGANTLYDIQRHLDISREEAVDLLSRLDLLELVVGRVDTADDRKVTRESIESRLSRVLP